MPAELGQTTDPKELVPGEPESISHDLRSTVGDLRTMDGIGSALGKVDPSNWTGTASEAFRSAFGQEPAKWAGALQRLSGGGQALADYGDVLAWGQGQAQRAIEQYTKAAAATRLAAAQANAQAQNPAVVGTYPAIDPTVGGQEAQRILDEARQRVSAAGEDVAKKLLGFTGDNKDSTYKTDIKGLEKEWKPARHAEPKRGYSVPEEDRPQGSPKGKFLSDVVGIGGPEKTLAEAKAQLDLLHGKLGGTFGDDTAGGSGQIQGSVLGAGADAKVTAGPAGVTAAANAEAYLAKGSAQGELHAGPAKLEGQAEGEVGAKAGAQAHVGPTGATVHGEAFAGAKVSGDASASVGGVGAGVHGEAWAGAGVEADGQLGMGTDGKFHIGGSLGAGLGVGGKVGFNVAVDPGEVVDTAKDVADDAGHAASHVGHAISDGAESIGNAFGL